MAPTLDVSRLADISVIHEGIGTVVKVALARKPVLGIGMMYEQKYNRDSLVRKGFAHRIRKTRLGSESVNRAILKLLTDSNANWSYKTASHVVTHYPFIILFCILLLSKSFVKPLLSDT